MKQVIFLSLSVFFMAFSLEGQNVPAPLGDYVQKYFPGQKVVKYETTQNKSSRTKYKVHLSNKTKIEFDQDYTLVELENKSGLSRSVLPAAIWTYVEKNYPDAKIKEWEKKKTLQEVTLTNDTELKFDLSGKFLKAGTLKAKKHAKKQTGVQKEAPKPAAL